MYAQVNICLAKKPSADKTKPLATIPAIVHRRRTIATYQPKIHFVFFLFFYLYLSIVVCRTHVLKQLNLNSYRSFYA